MAALLSAVLFGMGTPLAKLLLGEIPPLLLAGLLYLGSGVGLSLLSVMRRLTPGEHTSFFVYALRNLGTSRTSIYFGAAPFIGAIVSVILLNEQITIQLFALCS